jgi:hypothetical protein
VSTCLLLLCVPLAVFHGTRFVQVFRSERTATTNFFLVFHSLSVLSSLFLSLNGVFSGICVIFFQTGFGNGTLCNSQAGELVFGGEQGYYSLLAGLGFAVQTCWQAVLFYYFQKETVHSRKSAVAWQRRRLHWRLGVAAAVLLTLAAVGVGVSWQRTTLSVSIVAFSSIALLTVATLALVSRLCCTINYTYRILPYLSTRTPILADPCQSLALLVFAIAGGLIVSAFKKESSGNQTASFTTDETISSLLYSIASITLAASFVGWTLLLRKHSATSMGALLVSPLTPDGDSREQIL